MTSFSRRDLGHIASGMSCDFLRLWSNDTDFAELLQLVSELPGGIRPALVRNKYPPTPLRVFITVSDTMIY